MEVIVILLPLAVILGLLFIGGFIWMTYQGQYDDLKSPKYKMLLDDYKKKDGGDELNGH
ncbi:MAG: cbb3-type cytochrome oxidase assembly protein CcoS [Bacteriovoracaceae bacterium]|nr:cbb3-type cytochrome oxidase assembly protein CcoS [Bacteriovoracaceae bacterium]